MGRLVIYHGSRFNKPFVNLKCCTRRYMHIITWIRGTCTLKKCRHLYTKKVQKSADICKPLSTNGLCKKAYLPSFRSGKRWIRPVKYRSAKSPLDSGFLSVKSPLDLRFLKITLQLTLRSWIDVSLPVNGGNSENRTHTSHQLLTLQQRAATTGWLVFP